MNTDLTKEELDEAERIYTEQVVANNKGYDAYVLAGAYWDYGQQLISMARRTLQAEERLGRAVEALKEMTSGNMRCGYCDSGFDTIEAYAQAALDGIEDSPKDLPPPLPCDPPAHSDTQP